MDGKQCFVCCVRESNVEIKKANENMSKQISKCKLKRLRDDINVWVLSIPLSPMLEPLFTNDHERNDANGKIKTKAKNEQDT